MSKPYLGTAVAPQRRSEQCNRMRNGQQDHTRTRSRSRSRSSLLKNHDRSVDDDSRRRLLIERMAVENVDERIKKGRARALMSSQHQECTRRRRTTTATGMTESIKREWVVAPLPSVVVVVQGPLNSKENAFPSFERNDRRKEAIEVAKARMVKHERKVQEIRKDEGRRRKVGRRVAPSEMQDYGGVARRLKQRQYLSKR
mmetsp:Transcript_335/g.483  ORF Transcript_335/g.483 Transcript_335/m.483 type:complete len:200 (-) Transcript_335:154-753(-)